MRPAFLPGLRRGLTACCRIPSANSGFWRGRIWREGSVGQGWNVWQWEPVGIVSMGGSGLLGYVEVTSLPLRSRLIGSNPLTEHFSLPNTVERSGCIVRWSEWRKLGFSWAAAAGPRHRPATSLISLPSSYRQPFINLRLRGSQTLEIPRASRLPLLHEGMATHNAYPVKPHVPPAKIRNQRDRTRPLRQLPANRTGMAGLGAHPRDCRRPRGRRDCFPVPQIFPADT